MRPPIHVVSDETSSAMPDSGDLTNLFENESRNTFEQKTNPSLNLSNVTNFESLKGWSKLQEPNIIKALVPNVMEDTLLFSKLVNPIFMNFAL